MVEEYEEDVTFCIAVEGTDINLNYPLLVERLMEELRKIIQPISEAFKSFIQGIAKTFGPIMDTIKDFAREYYKDTAYTEKQSYTIVKSNIPYQFSTKPIIHKQRSMIRRTC